MASTVAGTDLLGSPVRRRIVDTLANLPARPDPVSGLLATEGLSAQELAEHLGLHVTTVRFHLDQLVTGGLVRSHFRRHEGAGRPRKLYAVERGTLGAIPPAQSFRMLSELLVDSLDADGAPRLTPEQAGEAWGRRRVAQAGFDAATLDPARSAGQWLGKIGQTVDLLKDWGYTPEVSTTNAGRVARVALHDCPFISLAHLNTAVVCGIHRGLLRGVLESLGETSTDVDLTPFVGPTLCVAALTATTPFDAPTAGSTPPHKEIHT